MADLVFFYGTLMAGFDRRRRAGIDSKLKYVGRGSIEAALFDLGIYPAAVPAPEGIVWGEVYEMTDPEAVLAGLDEIEQRTRSEKREMLLVTFTPFTSFSVGCVQGFVPAPTVATSLTRTGVPFTDSFKALFSALRFLVFASIVFMIPPFA